MFFLGLATSVTISLSITSYSNNYNKIAYYYNFTSTKLRYSSFSRFFNSLSQSRLFERNIVFVIKYGMETR